MAYENNDNRMESIYSNRVRAGKRRTYFFDVRATRGNDFFLTITESRKRFTGEGYDRHKIFLYKEDFNKFIKGLNDAVDHVKTELMPDFDFDAFSHEDAPSSGDGEGGEVMKQMPVEGAPIEEETSVAKTEVLVEEEEPVVNINPTADEEVDKW